MFKTYINKYYLDTNINTKDIACELASLRGVGFVAFVDSDTNYFVWDGFKWFSLADKDYCEPTAPTTVVTDLGCTSPKELKTVSMRKYATVIGSRNVAPIYNFETGSISMIGINYEDLGGIIKINDEGNNRVFSYGIRGSEFYFEEL